jgi:DNA-binding NarL/FixJ family response regulator
MRLGLVSSKQIYRDALAALLSKDARLQIVAAADSAAALFERLSGRPVDAVLVDEFTCDADEAGFLRGAQVFASFSILRIVDRQQGERLSDDELPKSASGKELAERLISLTASPSTTPAANPMGLSRREYEIAQLLANGSSNRQISVTTGLREQSIKNMVTSIMRKLECDNRTQVALKMLSFQS